MNTGSCHLLQHPSLSEPSVYLRLVILSNVHRRVLESCIRMKVTYSRRPVQWTLVLISRAFDERHTISKLWFQIRTGDCDSYSTFWQQGKFEFLKSVYLCTSKHYSKEHFVHLQQFHKAHGEVTIQQHSSTAFQKAQFFFFFFFKGK